MKKKAIERNELIATRVPPGDKWVLVDDKKKVVHDTLTDALEAFFHQTGFNGAFRLDPVALLYLARPLAVRPPERDL